MSHTEVKTWQFRCDQCGKVALVTAAFFERPEGWSLDQIHDCGFTGYTKNVDLCAICAKKNCNHGGDQNK